MSRRIRIVAALGSTAVLALIGLTAAVTQGATPSCTAAIAGTYYKSSDFIITLAKDNSLTGQYSQTTQDFIGQGETFSGRWSCSGNTVTIKQFHFLVSETVRQVERGNATGTFDGSRKLSLTYTFHVFAETASAHTLRTGEGTVVNVPTLDVVRVSS